MSFLLLVHVIVAMALIGLILIQHGKGADAGAAFGGGGSNSVIGGASAGTVLSRATAILATLFFAISLMLYIFAARESAAKKALAAPMAPVTTGTSSRPAINKPKATVDRPKIDSKKTDAKKMPAKESKKPAGK